jgi:hypothetical protein
MKLNAGLKSLAHPGDVVTPAGFDSFATFESLESDAGLKSLVRLEIWVLSLQLIVHASSERPGQDPSCSLWRVKSCVALATVSLAMVGCLFQPCISELQPCLPVVAYQKT